MTHSNLTEFTARFCSCCGADKHESHDKECIWYEGDCRVCDGTGIVFADGGGEVYCPNCSGSGTLSL